MTDRLLKLRQVMAIMPISRSAGYHNHRSKQVTFEVLTSIRKQGVYAPRGVSREGAKTKNPSPPVRVRYP